MPKTTLNKAINKIKDQLIQEKEHLEKELGQLAKRGKRGFRVLFKNFGSGEDEHAASVATLDNNLSLEINLEKSLLEVDRALESVKKGKYGICEVCGKKIDPKRLKIFPAAVTCVECKRVKK